MTLNWLLNHISPHPGQSLPKALVGIPSGAGGVGGGACRLGGD